MSSSFLKWIMCCMWFCCILVSLFSIICMFFSICYLYVLYVMFLLHTLICFLLLYEWWELLYLVCVIPIILGCSFDFLCQKWEKFVFITHLTIACDVSVGYTTSLLPDMHTLRNTRRESVKWNQVSYVSLLHFKCT